MRRLAAALPLPLSLALVPSAQAASVRTDRRCYLDTPKTTVTINGSGYTPGRPYTVTLDGRPLTGGSALMDGAGGMQGAFNPPDLRKDQNERQFTVGVRSDQLSAQTKFTVTRFVAGFTPAKGNPLTMKVRFSVSGFALAGPHPDVYLHYVTPEGTLAETIRLGRAEGQCGSIVRTKRRRLFPFDTAVPGKWQLQFDTQRAYHRGHGHKFLFYTVGVDLFAHRR